MLCVYVNWFDVAVRRPNFFFQHTKFVYKLHVSFVFILQICNQQKQNLFPLKEQLIAIVDAFVWISTFSATGLFISHEIYIAKGALHCVNKNSSNGNIFWPKHAHRLFYILSPLQFISNDEQQQQQQKKLFSFLALFVWTLWASEIFLIQFVAVYLCKMKWNEKNIWKW